MSSVPRPAALLVAVLALATACRDGQPATTSPSVGDVVAHATEVPPLHPSVDGYPSGTVEIVAEAVTHRLAVLVADTSARRQHGLMEVPELPDGVGMLFTGYETDRSSGFWMKDTLVPLSIAYLAADGAIVAILDMEPCAADPCPSYAPAVPYRSALEVRQGWFSENDVSEGAVVRLTADP